MYRRIVKRFLDIVLSLTGLIVLSPVILVLMILVRCKLGSPIIFKQERPGYKEKIFTLRKFRTMTDERDENGELLPDNVRLTKFGSFLRKTSLDELPELFNILKGDMSLIGPRPLLVSYLPYYTKREQLRHTVRPGLTGLAQVSGRNYIEWDKRLEKDVEYVENLSFLMDLKVLFKTIKIVFEKEDVAVDTDVVEGNLAIIRGEKMKSNGFSVYTLKESDKWHEKLKLFPKADVYYYPEYADAFCVNGDGEPNCLCYEKDGFCALSVVMKRPVPNPKNDASLTGYYDYVTPYGYGGVLMNDSGNTEAKRRFFEDYKTFCEKENIVAEFVRFHPVINNAHAVDDLYQVIDLGHTVCMDTESEEIIWQNITSKNRNMIRKAEKNGVEIRTGNSKELYVKFEEIYNETMRKVEADDYYFFKEDFYDSIRERLKDNAMLFYAVKEEEIIAMSIILFTEDAMHYHLSASKREYQTYAPTNLILYKAACWGAQNSMKTFHLGGGLGSREDHLYHFKKEFNRGEDTQFSIGKKVWIPEIYEKLCEQTGADPDASFFPRYRA